MILMRQFQAFLETKAWMVKIMDLTMRSGVLMMRKCSESGSNASSTCLESFLETYEFLDDQARVLKEPYTQ